MKACFWALLLAGVGIVSVASADGWGRARYYAGPGVRSDVSYYDSGYSNVGYHSGHHRAAYHAGSCAGGYGYGTGSGGYGTCSGYGSGDCGGWRHHHHHHHANDCCGQAAGDYDDDCDD